MSTPISFLNCNVNLYYPLFLSGWFMDDDGWMCFERSPQNESQIHSPLGFGCHVWMSLVSHHPIQTSIAHYSLPGSTNKPRSLNGFMDAADGHWPFTLVRFFTATPVPEWVKEFQTHFATCSGHPSFPKTGLCLKSVSRDIPPHIHLSRTLFGRFRPGPARL